MSGTIHLNNNKNSNSTNTSFYGSFSLPKKHNHIVFFFKKFQLIYNDPRRFGFIKIINSKKSLEIFFNRVGPEPLDNKFKINYICDYFKGKKKCIKSFLLDQKFVSGIGNIYASEILFESKINPKKKSGDLSDYEMQNIVKYSKIVLNNSIKKGGSSIRNFVNTSGNYGGFQKYFKVYDRENKNCLRKNCKGKIIKRFISNRSY